jgi:phosphomannomutase
LTPDAFIFDMDGTLTESRRCITRETLAALKLLGPTKLYLVTGSDMVKVVEQMGTDVLLERFERVMACNGTRVWNCNIDLDDETKAYEPDLIHKVSLTDHYSQADINHITSTLLKLAADNHTKYKTGTFVEWRDSQINFSLIGRNCTIEQRDDYAKWDSKSGERDKAIEQLEKTFQGWGLSFRKGGQISIDITRKGWDKSYAFRSIKEKPEKCVFFGDRIDGNGNDSDIAVLCKTYHEVSGPEETVEIIKSVYNKRSN